MADVPLSQDPSEPTDRAGVVARWRGRGEELVGRGEEWLDRRRHEAMPVDLAVEYYERDRDSFASVLGAAIALRLFLFFVPAMLFVTTIVLIVLGHDGVTDLADQAGVTGGLAKQIDDAATTSTTTSAWLAVVALWLTIWAGRTLTKVLAACSAGAWRMGGRESKATLRMAASVTTLVFLLIITAAVMNRIRETQGLAVLTTSWVVVALVYTGGWFLVSATLPRRTTDPGALLPGAVTVGAALAALQWFMQYYLPAKLSHTTALTGSVGASVVTLGYMFLIGRVMASSLILDAVVFERLGSVSELFFALPVLRLIPRRFPSVARYFDLGHEPGAGDEHEGAGPPETAARPGTPEQPT